MTRRPPALLAVLLASLLGSADLAAAAERCKLPRGATLTAASSYTRVYQAPVPGSADSAYACNRRTGRRFRLDDPDNGVRMFGPQLAGPYLAYELQVYSGESVGYNFFRLDLSKAKRLLLGSYSEDSDEMVWDYRLVKSGAIAWSEITDREEVGSVWLLGEGGKQRLDTGTLDVATSFAVSDNRRRIYWTNAGEARTALLR